MPPTYPDPTHAHIISRTTFGPVGHEWTGNEDDAGEHHGLLSLNEAPCYLARYLRSRAADRTVHVRTFELRLCSLARAGCAQEKADGNVRVRFVPDADRTVSIRPNEASPGLPAGVATFG